MKYKKGFKVRDERSNGDSSQKGGGDVPPSIHLDIKEMQHTTTFFGPWFEPTPASGQGSVRDPPEKRLTLLALRLAVMEKVESGLGKLAFTWATVVILGGFASSLRITDFWCVAVILVSEAARVFARSHELEWQQYFTIRDPAAAVALDDGRAQQFQRQVVALVKQRTWHAPEVRLLPYTGKFLESRKIGRLLIWLQVISAFSCVVLSLMRLWMNLDFLPSNYSDSDDKNNMRPALLLFYTLALLEALLFLMEKASWSWMLSVRKLLEQVSKDCKLEVYGLVSLKVFFHNAYRRCITGSIFDGIKMDLVTFAEDLILSDFLDEQLIGVRILECLTKIEPLSACDTLCKVGTSHRSVERLVEMLNWKRPDPTEVDVRKCAAEVVSRLASKRQNVLHLWRIPDAIESVMTLLYTGPKVEHHPVSEAHPQQHAEWKSTANLYLPLNLLGLQILKRLARDHGNRGKIGNTRDLVAKIIDFTHAPWELLGSPQASEKQVDAVKHALQVVKMLVSTTGQTGKALRRDVAENVFSMTNLLGILQNGHQNHQLQKLAMHVLTGLAMDQKGTEAIVGTGGLVKLLLSMFLSSMPPDKWMMELGCEAGKALAMLAMESSKGCAAILKTPDDVLDRLLKALKNDARRLIAARVLRNLCAYSGAEHRQRLCAAGITKALPTVLNATMVGSHEVLEVSIGLTTEICKFVDGDQFAIELRASRIEERAYVDRLASVLQPSRNAPEISVPGMRRFEVQQLVWLMENSAGYVELLREVGMQRLLEKVAETTSELECYHMFSGSVGIGKHREDIAEIVESAMELLAARA